MKHMKRFMALFAALALVFAMAVPAWAATASPTTATEDQGSGTITIEKAHNGETYKLYRIFDLVSYTPADATAGTEAKAVYKVTSAWKTFISSQTSYVTLDAKDQPTWVTNADVAEFAKLAKTAAASITPVAQVTAADDEAKFTNVKDGYYLVSTTTGTLCSLNTETGTELKIDDKNDVPTVEKKVETYENSGVWQEQNTAKIGDVVSFKTTISVKEGAVNYVLHDKMEAGLTLQDASITVKVNNQTVTTGENTYTVKTASSDKADATCTFEIAFAESYVAGLAGKDIVVTYKAVLNENAEIYTDSNDNDTWLKYGDSSESVHKDTKTYAYSFDLVKTTSSNELLAGAEFELYSDAACNTKINLVKVNDNTYRVATTTEATATGFASATIVTNATSKITIKGLKGETDYYLKETKAPQGYNQLTEATKVELKSANLDATLNGTTYTDGGVHVINNAGTTLPGTGGIGTTIFYVIGGGLMAAAAVLLIAKKRMENK